MTKPRIVKSNIGENLTNSERAWLFADKCPDCQRKTLTDTAHAENGVPIGFETEVTCECGFSAVMTPPRKGMVIKRQGAS